MSAAVTLALLTGQDDDRPVDWALTILVRFVSDVAERLAED